MKLENVSIKKQLLLCSAFILLFCSSSTFIPIKVLEDFLNEIDVLTIA